MSKTEWYPPHINPVRPGVYETKFENQLYCLFEGFSNWNGVLWSNQYDDIESAKLCVDIGDQNKTWRGLTSEAAKTKQGEMK